MQRLVAVLSEPRAASTTDITAVFRQYLDQVRHRHSDLLFVVSDFVKTDDSDIIPARDWRPILNQLQRNVVPVIVSFEVPEEMQGLVKLCDVERKRRRITWLSRPRISRVNREERERVKNLARSFRAAGLDYMVVSRQIQIYPQLARLARMRRQRKH
jgi:hypothetical protein